MAPGARRLSWPPIALGVVAELLAIAVGLWIPLASDPAVRTFLAIALLNVGVLGGGITGLVLSGPWRTNALHGAVTGVIGGAVFGVVLFGTVTNAVPSPRYAGFWTIHYLVATALPIPSWAVVRYGRLVVGGIAVLVGSFVAIEGSIAAGAVASPRDPPEAGR